MTKDELKYIMRRHYILECELNDVIRFVHELLVRKADALEKTEPYATVTIKSLYDAACEVDELEYEVDEIMEGNKNENED